MNGLYIYWFNSFESKCKVLQGKHSNFASECKRFVSKHKISQGITKLEWECITFPQKKCVFTQETAFKGFYKQTVFCCLFCFLVRMQKCLEILHAKTLKLHFFLYFLHLRCCIETLLKSWTWEIYLHNSQKMLFAGNHVCIYIYICIWRERLDQQTIGSQTKWHFSLFRWIWRQFCVYFSNMLSFCHFSINSVLRENQRSYQFIF